jgi:hypothetical protein
MTGRAISCDLSLLPGPTHSDDRLGESLDATWLVKTQC